MVLILIVLSLCVALVGILGYIAYLRGWINFAPKISGAPALAPAPTYNSPNPSPAPVPEPAPSPTPTYNPSPAPVYTYEWNLGEWTACA